MSELYETTMSFLPVLPGSDIGEISSHVAELKSTGSSLYVLMFPKCNKAKTLLVRSPQIEAFLGSDV